MKFVLTSGYGLKEAVRGNVPHTGIDLAMPKGTELHSIADGLVTKVYDGSTNIGYGVKVHTDNGTDMVWGHMDKVSVHKGDFIQQGDLLGLSGNSGHSTGPHLHFGEMQNGHFIDPTSDVDLLQKFSGATEMVKPPWYDLWGNLEYGAREHMGNMIMDFLGALSDVVVSILDNVVLIGGSTLIILGVAGYKDGYRYASIMLVARILIKVILGGYV
jgi:hypothetical protein